MYYHKHTLNLNIHVTWREVLRYIVLYLFAQTQYTAFNIVTSWTDIAIFSVQTYTQSQFFKLYYGIAILILIVIVVVIKQHNK